MADYNVGKGVYIWQPSHIEGGDPARIAARLNLAGVQSVALKICDGDSSFKNLEPLVQTLRANGIRVAGWGYSYLNVVPRLEAQAVINACQRYQPDFYLIDVEKEVEGNPSGAEQFMIALRNSLPDLPLGLNSFWSVSKHPVFPWEMFLRRGDFACPQVYWRGEHPVEKLQISQREYAQKAEELGVSVPMPLVDGDMFSEFDIKPTVSQLLEFLTYADSDPTLQGIFMWAADETETTPELWRAFSAYQWKSGPNPKPIPPQPYGWAKVIPGAGLNIRAAPEGLKIGALAKGQMVPLWEATESKWAAITPEKDQWIFIGDPRLTEVSAEFPAPPPPPPGQYSAIVSARRGLNVRDAIGGNVLRALPYLTVVQVYEEKEGWARIHPTISEWVSAAFLSKK